MRNNYKKYVVFIYYGILLVHCCIFYFVLYALNCMWANQKVVNVYLRDITIKNMYC